MDTATENIGANLKTCLANLEDPRNGPAQVHELLNIVVIAVCAIVCGANRWTEVEAFGKAQQAWLSTFLALPGGYPRMTRSDVCSVTWIQKSLRLVSGNGLPDYVNGSRAKSFPLMAHACGVPATGAWARRPSIWSMRGPIATTSC